MTKILRIFQILLVTALASCSSDDDITIKDAVSVFKYSSELKIDPKLQKQKHYLPKQTNNSIWFGGSKASQNLNIENFEFASKITKKRTISAGTRSFTGEKKVFKPVIVGNVIYTLDGNGKLIAKNLENSKTIYKKRLFHRKDKNKFTNGKIYYYEGKIFATSGLNYITAANAKDGEIIWSKKIRSMLVSTPIAYDGKVFAITDNNETYAFDTNNGKLKWIHKGINKNTAILGAADPVIYKKQLISSYSSGEIYLLNQRTGREIWVHDLNLNKAINSDFVLNDVDATPIVKNNVVYAIGNGGLMMAISVKEGNVLWSKKLSSISDFWIANNFIYLINNDNQLICLDLKRGAIRWFKDFSDGETKPKNKIIFNGLIMAGNNLIVSSSRNKILVVSPVSGRVLQKYKVPKNVNHTPIIVDKKIYLHSVGTFKTNLTILQ